MNPALSLAKSRIDDAVHEFAESLHLLPHLTTQQRFAVTKAARQLSRQCMQIQWEMDRALIAEAFAE